MKRKLLPKSIFAISVCLSSMSFADIPTSGDYVTDQTKTFTNNYVQETLDQINGILCLVKQTNPESHTNNTPYLALVDMNACNMGSGAGSSAPNIIPVYARNILENGIMSGTLWFDGVSAGPEGNTRMLIKASMEVTSPQTLSNQYGEFEMNFVGYLLDEDGEPTTDIAMRGHISSTELTNGDIQLVYVEGEAEANSEMTQMILVKQPNGTGIAKIVNDFGDFTFSANAEYNASYLQIKANNNNNAQSLCYDRTNYVSDVYRYGLYNTEGNRVEINTGFPIEFTPSEGARSLRGWIGYHGVGLPGNFNIQNGDAVTKVNIETS